MKKEMIFIGSIFTIAVICIIAYAIYAENRNTRTLNSNQLVIIKQNDSLLSATDSLQKRIDYYEFQRKEKLIHTNLKSNYYKLSGANIETEEFLTGYLQAIWDVKAIIRDSVKLE